MLPMPVKKVAPEASKGGKRADVAINAYARHRLNLWIDEGRTLSDFARASGLANSFLTNLKNHGTGVGLGAARGVAKALGMTLGQFIDAADAFAEENKPRRKAVQLRDRSGWADVRAQVIAEYRASPTEVDAVGDWAPPEDFQLTAAGVWKMIQFSRTPATDPPELARARAKKTRRARDD